MQMAPDRFFQPTTSARATSLRLVGLMALTWAVFFAVFSSFLQETYKSTSLDMALHSQLLWNLARGHFMQTSFLPQSFAAYHVWPALYLLLPVYQGLGIHGILALQCLMVASGAFAAYALTRDITRSEAWGRVFALAYLLLPTLSAGVLFDFHLELFSVPCALFALLGLRRNKAWFWPCLLLAFCFYEVTAGVFFFMGIGLLFRRGRRTAGGLLALLCLAYLGAVVWGVMAPAHGELALPRGERYAHLGSAPGDIFATVFRHPLQTVLDSVSAQDIKGLVRLGMAFGFLPLLSVRHVLPAVPLLVLLLLSRWDVNADIRFGYVAPAIPFLLLSAAHGAARLRTWIRLRRLAPLGPPFVLACSILLCADYQIRKPTRSHPFRVRENLTELRDVRTRVPGDAGLSADHHLGAHYADREVLLVTPATKLHGFPPVDYVLTDLNEGEYKNARWWNAMRRLLNSGEYGPVYFQHDVLLLRRGAPNDALSRAVLDRFEEQARTCRGDLPPEGAGGRTLTIPSPDAAPEPDDPPG